MTPARRAFLPLWTLAIVATVSAFVVHLTLRGKTVQLGYELGRERLEEGNLREVKRVLELEAASYKTPERVEIVARTLLGMAPPSSERIVPMEGATSAGGRTPDGSGRLVTGGRTPDGNGRLVTEDRAAAEHKRLIAAGLEGLPP